MSQHTAFCITEIFFQFFYRLSINFNLKSLFFLFLRWKTISENESPQIWDYKVLFFFLLIKIHVMMNNKQNAMLLLHLYHRYPHHHHLNLKTYFILLLYVLVMQLRVVLFLTRHHLLRFWNVPPPLRNIETKRIQILLKKDDSCSMWHLVARMSHVVDSRRGCRTDLCINIRGRIASYIE
jgi:hypothetical protein